MGIKDEYQFDYLDDKRRFADQINGALFHGKQVVKPDELEPMDPQTVYLGEKARKRKTVKTIVDKRCLWKGRKLHILAIENQNYVDYQMVIRNMLSESVEYNKQLNRKRGKHKRARDLEGQDEFLSGMKQEEKFTPVITLVVYFGKEHPWDGARCLYDLLDIDEEWKEFVTNYKINLYDCQRHDSFEEYQTGLRQVFETVRYGQDKEKLRKVIEQNYEAYSRIDDETKEMLEVVANVRIPEEFKIVEKGKERYNMCKAFEDMKLEGIEIGMAEGMKQGMEKGIEKGIQALVEICKEYSIPKEEIIKKCMEKFDLTGEKARAYAAEYGINF